MDASMVGTLVTAGITAVYTISRSYAKANEEKKAGYKTTEFWATAVTAILGVLSAVGILK